MTDSRTTLKRLRDTLVRHSSLGIAALLIGGLLPGPAYGAWYVDANWQNRQRVTISQAVTPATLTNFPYLVKIVDAGNPLFAKAQTDGDDLLFTLADGTTKLDHEIEFYDSSNGELWAWVKLPSLALGSDTEIYLYYGNASASDQQNTAGVWSNGYAAVYHLHGDFNDSVGTHPGTNTGSFNATGQVADGQEFSPQGGVDYVSLGGWNVSGNQLTIQGWINPDTFAQDDPRVLAKANDSSEQGHVWMLSLVNGSSGENRLRARLKTGTSNTSGTTTLIANAGTGDLPSTGQWNHAAMTYDGATMRLVRNGADAGSTAKSGNLRQNSWDGMIGNNPNDFLPNQYSWDGKLDEVRISAVARSLNWLTAESRNQGDPDSYQSLATEESVSCVVTTTVDSLTPGSLRACIIWANGNPGADTITVPAGTYVLNRGNGDDNANNGDLDITDALTLNGAGAGSTIIDGNSLDRVFDVRGGNTATLSDLTIQGGDENDGGGIRNQGTLTLNDVILANNTSNKGGGIRNQGTLTLNDVTLANNNSTANGGGVHNEGAAASVSATSVTFNGNTAADKGSGLYLKDAGTTTLTDVTFTSNTGANEGGGMFIEKSPVNYTGGAMTGNSASNRGGAIRIKEATINLTEVTLDSNSANSTGGGIYSEKGTLTILRTTLSGNSSADGGGIYVKDGSPTLTNVTLSGNSATNTGGGIVHEKDTLTLNNVTFSGNSAGGSGGGIRRTGGTVNLQNTIVANSPVGGDCSGTVVDGGNNLDSDGTCAVTLTAPPLLGSLANNGGPTQTHALFGGSPAIDTGNNLGCPATDQRGVVRPINGTCDIGAYEAPVSPPGPAVCQVDPGGTYIEAENFTGTIVQGATFAVESTTPGFNGSGYLRSTGGSAGGTPVHEGKVYNIDFTASGTYNVWMRGYALSGSTDSAFIGLNGTSVGALNEGGTYNTWVWSNGIQTGTNQITVPTTGFQDFNTWVREANHRIDGFYLTQGSETPTGGIPPGTPTLDPTQCAGANLALTKTDSADPVSTGAAFTYDMLVTNNGPLDATNVTLVDTLPADIDWQLATPSQGSCVHSGEPLGGTVTCTLGTIANGTAATVDIEVDAPPTTGVISNSATVSADEADPDASDNTATEETTIIDPAANLNVTQAEDFDPAGINLPFVYTVTVTNPGPANATLVTLVDTLDAAVTFQTAVPSQGLCAEAGGIVTCDLGGLANGSIATVDITVTAPATPQTVTNTAVVSAAEPDSDLSDNTWVEDTDVVDPPPADLELTKIDVPDPVVGGNPLTYTLTINNLGPGTATLVQLTDTLPASVTYVSATPSQGSCSETGGPPGGTVDCALGTLVSGAGATVTIVVTAPATAGTITNNASVSAFQSDPNSANNSASVDTAVTIVGDADLLLSKSDSPDPVLVNQALSYSLIIDNLGPDDATDVVLVDTLPAAVTFQSAISSQGSCSESGGTVTCNLGMINNAANATVDIIVLAPPSPGSITNNAVVSTSASDSDVANDTASETTTVQNLNVNQLCYLVADAGGGNGGNDLLTRIDTADFDPLTNETNIGTGTGTNQIEAIAWNSSTGVLYGANAGRLGTLNTITGVFSPLPQTFGTGSGANGNITFTDVDGLAYDPTTGVLFGSERQSGTDVLIQIDMATGAHVPNAFGLGLDYVPMPPISGNSLTDDIAVDPITGVLYAAVNSGGSTDRLIRVNKTTGATTDVALITVPDIEGLGTDPTGQLWGTSGTQRILYELDKVTGIGSNGRPINNGSDYESVDCYAFSPSVVADLAVAKIVDDTAPAEGATATYTVTATNTGPGIATVVQLSDVLPAGVTFASAIASQGTYSSTTGEWFVGTISAGSNATLNLQASVDIGSAGSTITNTASVTFVSQYDPNAGNDVASADIVPVALPASLLVLKSVSTVRDPLGATAPAALAIPGAVVQYEVSVSNSGGGAATETIITDTLSSNLTFLAGEFDGGAADIEIIVGTAPPVYCIAEVGGDTNTDGCFLSAAGDDLTVTIPVSGSYPTGLTVGATAPDNVVVIHFRATVN